MARNPNYTLSYTLRDRSKENASFSLNTDGLIDISDVLPVEVTNFETALATVVDGTITNRRALISRKASNADVGAGQREDRFMITYEDTVTLAIYTTEIGTRKSTLVTRAGEDRYDLDTAPFQGFVTAFEALARSFDGNPVNVLSITIV